MDDAKRDQIVPFLKEFKALMSIDKFFVMNRDKNLQALIEMGLTQTNRTSEIYSLTPENYISGPEEDRNQPGEIWVFGKTIHENRVYIKLKIADTGSGKIAKCLSFHPAEFEI